MTPKNEVLYKSSFLTLVQQNILKNDKIDHSEVYVLKKDVVASLLVCEEDNTMALIKQKRNAINSDTFEIVAGHIEEGETVLIQALKREIYEETGLEIEEDLKIAEFFTSPGFTTEKVHLYLCTVKNKNFTLANQEKSEDIKEIIFFTKEEILNKIKKFEINDAKTLIACLLFTNIS